MDDRSIQILDGEDVIEFQFADVEQYHGQHSIAGAALGYQVLRAALGALHPHDLPRREAITIVSGHPGGGFRDAFELVTRALTRQQYTVDTARPEGRYNPFGAHAYSWCVSSAARSVDLVLREGLIPHRFFELWHLVGQGAPDAWPELVRVKREVADTVLALPLDRLFTTAVRVRE